MNNKLEVIGIDHGWSMMKTISQVFVTGVKEITTTPALFGDVLEYEGKFYKVGTVRQEVKDTKVEDDSFYLLTLAAVAKELKRRGLAEAKVFLAVGLPLTRFGAEKNDFIKYLTKNKRVSFKYENEPYYIEIDDVAVFPQCYAAVVDKIPTMAKKTLIVDIGSWTIDIMPVINKSPDESKCVTIPKGLITCMSTMFIDRQPMGPHDLIQAFSRTNRIFDKNKAYGQIVTFQAPKLFKESVDNAVKLYSAGSTGTALVAEWKEIEPAFRKSLKALRASAETPSEIPGMSRKEKIVFIKMFQNFDKLFAQLKAFSQYDDSMLESYGITEDEYEDYAGHYFNVKAEIQSGSDDPTDPETPEIDQDYELMAYSHTKIDYEYIINLIQNIVTPDDDSEVTLEQRKKQIEEVKQYIEDLRKDNFQVADIMDSLVYEIELDKDKYKGQSILNIVENMKRDCIEKVVKDFCLTWYASKDDIMYAATHYRNGEIPNENAIKITSDFAGYKAAQEKAIPKFKYYTQLLSALKKTLDEEIKPLINN